MGLPARLAVRAGLGVAAMGGATLAYGVGYERNAFTVRAITVPVLPAGTRSLRLLHVSDLHLTPTRTALVAWVRGLARLEPDLVVATGDFLAAQDAGPTVVEALSPLQGYPGMFVPGNADYFAPVPKSPTRYFTGRRKRGAPLAWADTAAALAAGGWIDLTHVRTSVTIAGQQLEVRGVDDPYLGRDDYHLVAGPADPAAALRLGVAHAPEPRVLDAMTRDGVDLLLAGHTHGGQVRLPVLGALTTNCGIDRPRARGLHPYRVNEGTPEARTATLHVSAGLGTSPYAPIRLNCRPEATLLTLAPR